MDKSSSGGYCNATDPDGVWPHAPNMTNAEGCALLQNNPIHCRSEPICDWTISLGQTPDSYDAQIASLEKQYSHYIDQKTKDCPRSHSIEHAVDSCNEAKEYIENIKNTFSLMTNDLESDSRRLDKKISNINTQINNYEKINKVLSHKLSSALNKGAGAQGMIVDAQLLYNYDLISNWIILLCIIVFVCFLFMTGRLSIADSNTQTQLLLQKTNRYIPGITSMIPY